MEFSLYMRFTFMKTKEAHCTRKPTAQGSPLHKEAHSKMKPLHMKREAHWTKDEGSPCTNMKEAHRT